MWGDDTGLVRVNAIALLAGFIFILIAVMGGYTFASPGQAPTQNTVTPDDSGAYDVVMSETIVGVEKREGDPVVYDQLTIYLSGDGTKQRLPITEDAAFGDDGDPLFERDETIRRPLNASIPAGTPVTVKIVDAGGSEILHETTVNVTTSSAG